MLFDHSTDNSEAQSVTVRSPCDIGLAHLGQEVGVDSLPLSVTVRRPRPPAMTNLSSTAEPDGLAARLLSRRLSTICKSALGSALIVTSGASTATATPALSKSPASTVAALSSSDRTSTSSTCGLAGSGIREEIPEVADCPIGLLLDLTGLASDF